MMDILLDTNFLIRCIEPQHPLHLIAIAAMKELSARGDRLCIIPQIIYEYFVVCTRPPGQYGGLGMSNDSALAEIDRVTQLFELLPEPAVIYPRWLALIARYRIVGKRAHDTRLIAAMEAMQINVIATFNGKDFQGYGGVQLLSPNDLASDWTARPAL